jgi:cob(I)alamin adenosyltransferase
MIHLYYGSGKGKTTAAIGLALRSLSAGIKVIIVQFLKNKPTGEIEMLEKMSNVTVLRGKCGNHFTKDMSEEERTATKEISDRNFLLAVEACRECCDDTSKKKCTRVRSDSESPYEQPKNIRMPSVVLILDEACAAYDENLINRKAIEHFISHVPPEAEVIITGREPPCCFLDNADYCTEFRKIRHPFDKGIQARKGIEF